MMNDKDAAEKNTPSAKEPLTGFQRAVPILLFALAVFVALCFLTQNTGTLGPLISGVLLGLFSSAAFAVPVLILLHAIFYASDLRRGRRLTRLIFSAVFLLTLSCFIYAVTYFGTDMTFDAGEFYRRGRQAVGGGFFGGVLGYAITKVFGSVGMIVLAVLVFSLYLTYFFAGESNSVKAFALKVLATLASAASFVEKKLRLFFKNLKDAKEKRVAAQEKQKKSALLHDDFFAVDNGMQELEIEDLGILETRSEQSIEENPTLHETVYPKGAGDAPRRAETRSNAESTFAAASASPLSDTTGTDDRPPIIIDPPHAEEEPVRKAAKKADSYGLDESAESVFTQDFDPFDLTINRAMASKASTRAPAPEEGVGEYADSLEDEYRKKQKADRDAAFERKKQEILAGMKKNATPPPQTAPRRRRIIEFNEMGEEIVGGTVRESGSIHTSIEKNAAEEAHVAADTAPAGGLFFASPTRTEAPAAPETPLATATPSGARTTESPHNYSRAAAFASGIRQNLATAEEKQTPAKGTYEPVRETPSYRSEPVVEPVRETPSYRSEPVVEPVRETPSYRSEPVVEPARETPSYRSEPVTEPVRETPSYRSEPVVEPVRETPSYRSEPVVEPVRETPSYRSEPVVEPVTPVVEQKESTDFRPYNTEDAFRTVIGKAEPKPEEDEEDKSDERLRIERSVVPPFDSDEEDEGEDEPLTPDDTYAEEDAPSDEEIPPEERNPKIEEYRSRFSFLDESEDKSESEEEASPEEETTAPAATEEDEPAESADTDDDAEGEEDAPPFDGGRQINSRFTEYMNQMKQSEKQAKTQAEEKPAYVPPDYSDYRFPPVDFLLRGENTEDNAEEIQENAEKLIDTLASFKVTASIRGVDRGPRITRYEVVPARGVKVSAVTNLVDDISLAIAAEGIRMEAPIPGKSAIGFEIPNRKAQTVRLRDLIDTEEFAFANSKTTACIGKDVTGNPVFGDIAKMPHILVAGATGMGKSVCINAILISILYKARPDEVKFIMVDPKKVEFNNYNGIPHLLIPVVTESKQAAGALMWAVEEMEKRYELIEALRVKKIDDYNEKVKADPSLGTPMPKIIIIIDELNDLMVQVRDPVENLIMRLAQKARAAGIHLIIGTQRPSVNVLTGVIKANIPSRMTCKVSSNVDSRTILEQGGAEKLLNNGDMLYWPVGKPKPLRVQGAFVSDGELEKVMDYLKAQAKGNTYDESVLEEINRAAQKCSKKKDSMSDDDDGESDPNDGVGYLNDPTFLDIVELALNSGRIATSFIQRKMSIGYGRASKYIDMMEELGIVGEANGSKPRDVLITKDEWHEMLARRSLDD